MTDTTLPTEDLKALFDIATNSLNFGSGFLDKDEIDLLRRVAEVLGVDPMQGTPSNDAKHYPHAFKPHDRAVFICGWDCGLPAESDVHGDSGAQIVQAALEALPDAELASQIEQGERHAAYRQSRPSLYKDVPEDPTLDRLRAERARRIEAEAR
jgi:hypothetical protein